MLSNSCSLTCLLPRNEQPDRTTAISCMQRNATAVEFPWDANTNPVHCCHNSILHSLLVFRASFRLGTVHGYWVLPYTNFCLMGRDVNDSC